MTRVLVVATSRKTRGGITSVVKAHERGTQWNEFHCKWIETHRDKSAICKLAYLIYGFAKFTVLLPFYDIVHIHTSEPVSAYRKLPFVLLTKLWRKKLIVHFHAFSPETTFRSRHKNIYRILFSKADILIVLSPTWAREVKADFPKLTNIKTVYNPCPSKTVFDSCCKKKHILYAGTLNARKGYADMIKAFAMIATDFPDWRIVFAGNGEIEQGKTLASFLGIEKQTEFLGWVNGVDKDIAFKEASVFCLPSYAEGFPMAVLDAWAYGLPVVTTPIGGMPDIADDCKNILLFNPGDIEGMANCFTKMIKDESLRNTIAKESLKFSKEMFSEKVINNQIRGIYQTLCDK